MMTFKKTTVSPLTLARQFAAKFGYGNISIEQFDIWIIDHKMAEDPGTEEPRDPRYRAFREDRSAARTTLNRSGGECDEGERFAIEVMIPGKLYRTVPYAAAVLDDAANFGSKITKAVEARKDKLLKVEKRLTKMVLYGDADQSELAEVRGMISQCVDYSEEAGKQMRGIMHKMNTATEFASRKAESLMLKYDPEGAKSDA